MKRRMRDIVLLFAASFLVVAVSPATASSRSLRRAQPVNSKRTDAEKQSQRDLEGSIDSQDEYNQYYEEYDNPKYGNNRYENGWFNGAHEDDAAYAGNANSNSTIFYQVEQQVEEDMKNMWSEAPSEWNEEMWEVFGSVILLSAVIFICCFLICCTPCCSPDSVSQRTVQTEGYVDGDYDPNRDVAGRSPMQDGAHDKETSLLEGGQPDGSRAAAASADNQDIANVPSDSRRSNTRDRLRRSGSRSRSRTNRGRGGGEPSSRSGGIRKFKRKRRTLWQETVDVWGEFLTETFGTAEERRRQRYKRRDEARDSYKRFEEDPQPSGVASAGTGTTASDVEHHVQGQQGPVAYNTTATSTSVGATTDEDESKVARGTMA